MSVVFNEFHFVLVIFTTDNDRLKVLTNVNQQTLFEI